jgi:hypothetical protein
MAAKHMFGGLALLGTGHIRRQQFADSVSQLRVVRHPLTVETGTRRRR